MSHLFFIIVVYYIIKFSLVYKWAVMISTLESDVSNQFTCKNIIILYNWCDYNGLKALKYLSLLFKPNFYECKWPIKKMLILWIKLTLKTKKTITSIITMVLNTHHTIIALLTLTSMSDNGQWSRYWTFSTR